MSDRGVTVRVIGIGSPFGDDGLGIEAARRIAARAPAGVEVVAADRPGDRLLDLFLGCEAVILIDAAERASGESRRRPGRVHDVELSAAAAGRVRNFSSHGFGVAEAIALASALGRLPRRGRLLAVEVEPVGRCVDRLSPSAKAALEEVCRRIEHWIAEYRRACPRPFSARRGRASLV